MFIVPKTIELVASQDEIETLDRQIKETAEKMRKLIEQRDLMMKNYVLRPIRVGEVI